MRFVEVVTSNALDQLVVGYGIAVAEHHSGNLRVDDRVRNRLGHIPDDFYVLARSVKYFDHALVLHQGKKWSEIDPIRERVDDHSLLGRRHLRYAQQWIVGGFTQEFSIDDDVGVLCHPRANSREVTGCGYQIHRGGKLDRVQFRHGNGTLYLFSANARHVNELPRTRHCCNRNLYEGRFAAGKCVAQGQPQLGRAACAPTYGTETFGVFDEIWIGKITGDQPIAELFLLNAAHIAKSAIHENNRYERNSMTYGGGEPDSCVGKTTLTIDRKGRGAVSRVLCPQRRSVAPAQIVLIAGR